MCMVMAWIQNNEKKYFDKYFSDSLPQKRLFCLIFTVFAKNDVIFEFSHFFRYSRTFFCEKCEIFLVADN